MQKFTITPALCTVSEKNPTPPYIGEVEIKVPTSIDKLELMEELGLDVDDEGNVKQLDGKFKMISKMVRASERFYCSVNIKRVDDGVVHDSFEALNYDSGCLQILTEIATRVVEGGFKVSKN